MCEVHVIRKSDRPIEYDARDGEVLVHNVVPADVDFLKLSDDMSISRKNLSYSYSVSIKLLDLIDKYGIQIVEAPLWDAESFTFSLVKNVPLVVRLETPLSKVAEIQHWPITRDLRLANWLEGEAARRADQVIAISRNIGSMISEHHGLNMENISLCPLGISYPTIDKISSSKSQDNNVLFVGRLEKRKGIETLFDAIPAVVEKMPNVKFNIVGNDTPAPDGGSYKKYLLERLDKKYHANVCFIGYVSDDSLGRYYRDCDIFVAPSLYESFGLIYLEAMAWCKPVIGCMVGGVPEVVREGDKGLLVKPGEQKELAKAIIMLLSDDDLRIGMGNKGRMLVEEEFSINKMVERSYNVYCDTIKKPANKNLIIKD
jgi:glycosyltransferase involved in cell wall biosynthesis